MTQVTEKARNLYSRLCFRKPAATVALPTLSPSLSPCHPLCHLVTHHVAHHVTHHHVTLSVIMSRSPSPCHPTCHPLCDLVTHPVTHHVTLFLTLLVLPKLMTFSWSASQKTGTCSAAARVVTCTLCPWHAPPEPFRSVVSSEAFAFENTARSVWGEGGGADRQT